MNVDIPCRTLSSVRISKCVKSTSCSLSSVDIFLENPQRGASGDPFMNKTTLLWFISPLSLACRSSCGSFVLSSSVGSMLVGLAGALSVFDKGVYASLVSYLATVLDSLVASAPFILSRRVCPWSSLPKSLTKQQKRHALGERHKQEPLRYRMNPWFLPAALLLPVDVQCYKNWKSRDVAQQTLTKRTLGCLRASSFTTSFICLQGSAHGAQKYITETLFRSFDRVSWKLPGESASTRFVEAIVVKEEVCLSSSSDKIIRIHPVRRPGVVRRPQAHRILTVLSMSSPCEVLNKYKD